MDPITRSDTIAASDLLTTTARQWLYNLDNLAYVNKPMKLFGSSTKVEKGADKRDTYILYLQPAGKVAKHTLCLGAAVAGCEAPCLISSGQLGMSTGQRAATKRTILLLLRPEWFKAQLLREIDKAERKAQKTGIPALFRLNGTSDIDWAGVIAQRPRSQFYDYTKVLARVRLAAGVPNYHVTYSGSMYTSQSKAALRKAVQRGHNVAVAVNTKDIPADNITTAELGLPSFDSTDLRPLDPTGTIGVLKRKGSNKAQRAAEGGKSFFVTEANKQEFIQLVTL
jgi:hypothetical protein